VQRGLEQRDVAVAADAVPSRPPESREQRDRGRVAAGEVDEREAALGRRAARLAGEALPPREPLHHVVVAALGGTRAAHAEARERAAHDPRVHVAQLVVRQAELPRLVATQVRVDGVAHADEVVEHGARVGMPEIERDAPLPAVERLEEERVLTFLERRHVAADVAGRGRVLELDDVRSEVGELERAPRPRAELLDGEDADVGERQAHVPDASGSRAAFQAFS
jgi:hypothetical protein